MSKKERWEEKVRRVDEKKDGKIEEEGEGKCG